VGLQLVRIATIDMIDMIDMVDMVSINLFIFTFCILLLWLIICLADVGSGV
jgi:hypothetical protein